MSDAPPVLARFAGFALDEANAQLSRDGQPVDLPPRAFDVLCALARRPGQLVTKDQLLDAVWGHQHVSESVLKTTISQLRAALEDDAKAPRYIETAARRGYRFIATLEGVPATPPPAPSALPSPAVASAPHIVGRAAALAALRGCLDTAVRQSRRQLLFVAGEPGIGKSTLIDAFIRGLGPGVAHAHGQCVEHYGAGEPYMPVLEALNGLCRQGEAGAALLAQMRRVAPSWLVQLPWFLDEQDRQRLQREVAGTTQDRMLREFGELTDRGAAERPLLLVLEDLHWADHATVQLLGYLARRRGPAALLVLGSFRPTEIIATDHPLAGLRHELRLHRLCEELDLESFSEAELGALVARRLGGTQAPDDFVQALHAHTEGLPLFAVSMLDELMAEGRLRQDAGGWQFPQAVGFGVPHSVAGVVERQIERLAPEQQRLLGAASVLGNEFGHPTLAALLQQPEDDTQAWLDAAARGAWLLPGSLSRRADGGITARYTFRHALYRHVHYQRLGAGQRLQWHALAAQALQAQLGPAAPEAAGELAMHCELGGHLPAAARWLAVASARALGRGAAQEALTSSRRGLALLGDTPPPELALDLKVLEGVALTRRVIISQPEVAEAFEQARRLCDQVSDSPARARAMQGLWWVSFARGELPAARRLAERIHGLGQGVGQGGGDLGLALAGHNAMGMTLGMSGEFVAARQHLQASVTLLRDAGGQPPPGQFVQDPGVEALSYLALMHWWCGEPAEARRCAAEATMLAAEIRHPISQLTALHLASVLHLFAGEVTQGLSLIDRLFATIAEHELPPSPGAFGWVRGALLAMSGRVDEGLAAIDGGERSTQANGMRIGLGGYYLNRSEACRLGGRMQEAAQAARDGIAHVERAGERAILSALLRLDAEYRFAAGDRAGAASTLQRALEVARAQEGLFHELVALGAGRELGLLRPALERVQLLVSRFAADPSPVIAQALRRLGA